ncbi:hypothetical protein [Zoogloea sp.]|uniref:hypothetical protein n=1 Tax=Zoogloea sp. TaxID=49181 RepID=UPI001415ED8A|nr:MAG: hypothetical protein F9K15_18490 [Zoogloea sp.]
MTFRSIRLLAPLPLLAACTCLQAEPLGRLFFSPAERTHLEQPQPRAGSASPPPRLDGIITRSEGPPTLFLDGEATPGEVSRIRMRDSSALVTTPDGRTHRLRVGSPPPSRP